MLKELLPQRRAAQHAGGAAELALHTLFVKAMATASSDGDPAPLFLLFRVLAHDAEIVGRWVLDRMQTMEQCDHHGDKTPCRSLKLWAAELGHQPMTFDLFERVFDLGDVTGLQPPFGDRKANRSVVRFDRQRPLVADAELNLAETVVVHGELHVGFFLGAGHFYILLALYKC